MGQHFALTVLIKRLNTTMKKKRHGAYIFIAIIILCYLIMFQRAGGVVRQSYQKIL